MAATAHASPTLARSSPFLFSSPSTAPPRPSSLRPATPRSDFLGCGGAGLRPPRGRRWRAPSPRLRRLLVRAAFDGRSVVLALAAAAANFAVLRLVLLNFARLRKKSKELADYSNLGIQNTATNSQHISNNISQLQNDSVSKDPRHFHAPMPKHAQTIEEHEAVTLGDPRALNTIGNIKADVMFEEGIANMEEPKTDRHEYILGQDQEILVNAAVSIRTVTEFPENALPRENVNEESAKNGGPSQTLIDHKLSIDSQSNFQGKNRHAFLKMKQSGLIPPLVNGITGSESEKKDSSFSLTFNKVGVSDRIKRSVKGRSFVKEKAVYRKIDGTPNLLPIKAHVKHESRSSEYLKAYIRFLREGRLTDCLEVLENGEKKGLLDMDKVYHVRFLNVCKSQKAVNEAFRFVKLIKNPTLSTFNMLLSVCACSQDFEGAFQVLLLIKEADLKADCRLYTTLISTCAKSGKVDTMFEIFHEMVNSGVVPNVHTYGALIDGCARAGQVAKAFGAYGIMRSKNVIPDRVIFNALITACGQSGAVDRAFDVLAEMGAEPTPIEPDHVTVGALMKTCARAGQVDRAREVYILMQRYNIKGTPEVYTIAVNSCSESGDLEFALMVYNDMKQNGVVPDEMFLSALIDAAGHAGKVNIAFEILQTARSQGAKLGIISYSSLMGACCNSKNWQKALELFEDMKTIELLPTVSTVNALITVLCEANQLKRSVEVLAEVKEAGVILNTITYSVLLVACEKMDEVELGLKLFSEAKLDGVPPNLIMFKCLTGLCLRRYEKAFSLGEPIFVFGSGRLQLDSRWTSSALFVYREMIGAGIMPSMEVFSQVLGSLKLPHDVSFRNRLVENLGVSSEAFRRFNIFSLLDGFGEYDPRSFSLFEEAASLGVVRSVSFKESPIVIDTRKLEVRTSEVYLITVLKGLKHRLAAGAKLPNITILLHVEKTVIISPRVEKTVALAGRVGQAVCAMLRRLGLPYQGGESYGKVRINGLTLRRWFQPKLSSDRSKGSEPNLHVSSLAKAIIDQQRNIRTSNLSID